MLSPVPSVESVEGRLTLELRPSELELGGRQWAGFSYRLRFRSATLSGRPATRRTLGPPFTD